jgi:hypothetical protein
MKRSITCGGGGCGQDGVHAPSNQPRTRMTDRDKPAGKWKGESRRPESHPLPRLTDGTKIHCPRGKSTVAHTGIQVRYSPALKAPGHHEYDEDNRGHSSSAEHLLLCPNATQGECTHLPAHGAPVQAQGHALERRHVQPGRSEAQRTVARTHAHTFNTYTHMHTHAHSCTLMHTHAHSCTLTHAHSCTHTEHTHAERHGLRCLREYCEEATR